MAATALQYVDLIRADERPAPGLLPVRGARTGIGPDEAAILDQAAHLQHVDHVFFRRFGDGRSSQAAAFVVDNSDERLSDEELAQVRHFENLTWV